MTNRTTRNAWRDKWLSVDVLDQDGHVVGGGCSRASAMIEAHPAEYEPIFLVASGQRATASLGSPATNIIRRATCDDLAAHARMLEREMAERPYVAAEIRADLRSTITIAKDT